MRWCLISPTSPLLTQPFIQVQIKENIKALRHWPLCGEFTGDWWIPHTNVQYRRKCFHLTTSSWACLCNDSSPIQARITKFGPEVQNTLLLRSLLFWGDQPCLSMWYKNTRVNTKIILTHSNFSHEGFSCFSKLDNTLLRGGGTHLHFRRGTHFQWI